MCVGNSKWVLDIRKLGLNVSIKASPIQHDLFKIVNNAKENIYFSSSVYELWY